jgi:hypothetical protein
MYKDVIPVASLLAAQRGNLSSAADCLWRAYRKHVLASYGLLPGESAGRTLVDPVTFTAGDEPTVDSLYAGKIPLRSGHGRRAVPDPGRTCRTEHFLL